MTILVDVRPIGPTTWRAVLRFRDTSRWRDNGSMTYRRKIRSGRAVNRKWAASQMKPWKRSWLWRPKNAPPGSYEFARLAHLEMERIALRRPQI